MVVRVRAALVGSVALASALAACGGDEGSATKPESPQAAQSPAPPQRHRAATAEMSTQQCAAALGDDLHIRCTSVGPDLCNGAAPPAVPIVGVLVDAAGESAPCEQLRFWSRRSIKNATTDFRGRFELVTDDEDAVYDVDLILGDDTPAPPAGRRFHAGTVRSSDRDVVLRLPIARQVIASGTIIDEAGRPLAGSSVSAGRTGDDGTAKAVGSAIADDEGRFRIMGWVPEHIALEVRMRDAPRAITAQHVDSATSETRLTVGPPAIAGWVSIDGGGSADGAFVRLRRVDGGDERSMSVNASGQFRFDAVGVDADYELSAQLTGYFPVERLGVCADSAQVCLALIAPTQVISGRLLGPGEEPARIAWLRFVAAKGESMFQAQTEIDGTFRTSAAHDIDYDVFALAPGPDGRLVPGPKIARCHGGATDLILRVPR